MAIECQGRGRQRNTPDEHSSRAPIGRPRLNSAIVIEVCGRGAICAVIGDSFGAIQRVVGRSMEFFLEELSRPEMSFSAGRDVNDLTRTGVSGSRLRARLFNLKDAKSTDFDPLGLHQALAHGLENGVYYFGREILLAARLLADPKRQFPLGGGAQNITSRIVQMGGPDLRSTLR